MTVTVEGIKVPAGTYLIYTGQAPVSGPFHFTRTWNLAVTTRTITKPKEAARFKVKLRKFLRKIETLTFNVGEHLRRQQDCKRSVTWENTSVKFA